MNTEAGLHMFLSDSNLCFSAWGITKNEAEAAIRSSNSSVGRLVYLGCQ